MNLRRDFELWTFNFVETAMDYEDLKVGLNAFCIMFKDGPRRLMFLNKSMGAREWNVMVCISLDQGVAPSEGVALLE